MEVEDGWGLVSRSQPSPSSIWMKISFKEFFLSEKKSLKAGMQSLISFSNKLLYFRTDLMFFTIIEARWDNCNGILGYIIWIESIATSLLQKVYILQVAYRVSMSSLLQENLKCLKRQCDLIVLYLWTNQKPNCYFATVLLVGLWSWKTTFSVSPRPFFLTFISSPSKLGVIMHNAFVNLELGVVSNDPQSQRWGIFCHICSVSFAWSLILFYIFNNLPYRLLNVTASILFHVK